MSKTFYKIIIAIQFVAIVMLTVGLFANDPIVSNKQTLDTELVSQSEILQNEEQYKKTYNQPYVKFLRTALDDYLAGDGSSERILQASVTPINKDGITSGLDSFDKGYYESKFVIFSIDDSISGGKDIQIIFQDKPDRIFYAWVYELSDDNYELRDFKSEEYPAEKMHEIVEAYKDYVFNKDLAI